VHSRDAGYAELSMHIAKRGFIVLIQIPLSFDFLPANSVRFIPMKFRATYSTGHKMNGCNSFEFTPAEAGRLQWVLGDIALRMNTHCRWESAMESSDNCLADAETEQR